MRKFWLDRIVFSEEEIWNKKSIDDISAQEGTRRMRDCSHLHARNRCQNKIYNF